MSATNDFFAYERPSLATDLVLMRIVENKDKRYLNKSLQVQLVKRDIEPFVGLWTLPGAFVNIDETIEDALTNKVFKKSGYDNFYLEQLFTFDAIDRDPRWRVIGVSYIGILKENYPAVSQMEAKWFTIADDGLHSDDESIFIPSNEMQEMLGFDHAAILNMALERLKNKIFYTDIAFNFVGDVFTLRELQDVFEAIVGKKINNFQRTMKEKIVETGEMMQGQAYRPARLYNKNKKGFEHND